MKPDVFFKNIVEPTIQLMAAELSIPATDSARVLLMAIAGQESNWSHRTQVGGPARSYWQFELGGGVVAVFSATQRQIRAVCDTLDVPCSPAVVFEAMAWNDVVACAMARLNLWRDPAPLPAVGDKDAAWNYYRRIWAPGAPHPELWPAVYDQALATVKNAGSSAASPTNGG